MRLCTPPGIAEVSHGHPPEINELLLGRAFRTPPGPLLGVFVIRAENKGNQIPVGTFEIERKVCQPVEPLLVKGMLRALRIENRPNDTRVAVVPRIPARERIVQVAAGNDYLAAAVGFKHDTPADGILLPVALIVGAIVHDRRQIDAEDSRIVPANSPSIRTAGTSYQ